MKKIGNFLKKSVLFENPALSLFVGIAPLILASTRVLDGAFTGLVAIVCIFISCVLFGFFKKIVPKKLRDVVYVLIVACAVTLCELLLNAFLPSIYKSIGMYLPLLCVCGLVFSHSKKFEKASGIAGCVAEGLTCGFGYFVTIVSFAIVREFFGRGSFAGFTIFPEEYAMSLLAGPVGGFFILGILTAVFRKFFKEKKSEEGKR